MGKKLGRVKSVSLSQKRDRHSLALATEKLRQANDGLAKAQIAIDRWIEGRKKADRRLGIRLEKSFLGQRVLIVETDWGPCVMPKFAIRQYKKWFGEYWASALRNDANAVKRLTYMKYRDT